MSEIKKELRFTAKPGGLYARVFKRPDPIDTIVRQGRKPMSPVHRPMTDRPTVDHQPIRIFNAGPFRHAQDRRAIHQPHEILSQDRGMAPEDVHLFTPVKIPRPDDPPV
jgi:hypothetical protein